MKKVFYFLLAGYFAYFARKRLARWQPRVIVVTGSTGKTTLLHLLEAQLGEIARFSHHANSAYGVSFDILGMRRTNYSIWEWFWLGIQAPFCVLGSVPKQQLYVVEVDCDRPQEGEFLAELLHPEVTIWLSSTQTHAQNFDQLVGVKYQTVEEAIAYEFGNLLAKTTKLAILNDDSLNIMAQADRTRAKLVTINEKVIERFTPSLLASKFTIAGAAICLPALLPRAVGVSLQAVAELMDYLALDLDPNYSKFILPPGRSSVFAGKKNTTLIDSTYNASLDASVAMLDLFDRLKVDKKWLVVSDILEQGKLEADTHAQLARHIAKLKVDKIIVMGPRAGKHSVAVLDELGLDYIAVAGPAQVYDVLKRNLRGGETILFKGTRFLEGVIEKLLADPTDAVKLCRREAVWVKRRKQFGV